MRPLKQSENSHGARKLAPKNKTSWGNVASWYDELLSGTGTYQKDLILPNLQRLMYIRNNETVLDLACGQGFFTREFAKSGAALTGADISFELIKIAKANSPKNIHYIVSPADTVKEIKDASFDKISVILALQNIDNLRGTVDECFRVLKTGGKLFIVLNHPTFRVPQKSDWGYDSIKKVQYRRVERYLTETLFKIDMTPGEKNIKIKKYTTSYHRPLSKYFSVLTKSGFLISGLEEWVSHKKSQIGPKQKIEDDARKEIPMFMYIEAIKIKK